MILFEISGLQKLNFTKQYNFFLKHKGRRRNKAKSALTRTLLKMDSRYFLRCPKQLPIKNMIQIVLSDKIAIEIPKMEMCILKVF